MRLVTQGADPKTGRGAHLHRDRIHGRLRARRGARIAAMTSGGAIPEVADYRVVTEEDGTFVGTLNEDFAIESQAGDVFQLGNMSWRIRYVRGGEVVVQDAQGAPAIGAVLAGEAPGRTRELSAEVADAAQRAGRADHDSARPTRTNRFLESGPPRDDVDLSAAAAWLRGECGADDWTAVQAARYVAAQKAAIPIVPTQRQIVFERFFDESGGSQLVIHAPLGARINRAWGLAMRKRFCRSFDFELQASATDDGVLLSLGPQHSFPIDALFKMLNPQNGEPLLVQALLAAPDVSDALALERDAGAWRCCATAAARKFLPICSVTAPTICWRRSFRKRSAAWKITPAISNSPTIRWSQQTVYDCLHEAMDIDGWLDVLREIVGGQIELVPRRHARAVAVFAPDHQRQSLRVSRRRAARRTAHAGRVGAPHSRYRGRARSGLARSGRRSPRCADEAQPLVRDADELHDALVTQGVMLESEGIAWTGWFDQLVAAGRATRARLPDRPPLWIATENWPLIAAALPAARIEQRPALPASVRAALGIGRGAGASAARAVANRRAGHRPRAWRRAGTCPGRGRGGAGRARGRGNGHARPLHAARARGVPARALGRR